MTTTTDAKELERLAEVFNAVVWRDYPNDKLSNELRARYVRGLAAVRDELRREQVEAAPRRVPSRERLREIISDLQYERYTEVADAILAELTRDVTEADVERLEKAMRASDEEAGAVFSGAAYAEWVCACERHSRLALTGTAEPRASSEQPKATPPVPDIKHPYHAAEITPSPEPATHASAEYAALSGQIDFVLKLLFSTRDELALAVQRAEQVDLSRKADTIAQRAINENTMKWLQTVERAVKGLPTRKPRTRPAKAKPATTAKSKPATGGKKARSK